MMLRGQLALTLSQKKIAKVTLITDFPSQECGKGEPDPSAWSVLKLSVVIKVFLREDYPQLPLHGFLNNTRI